MQNKTHAVMAQRFEAAESLDDFPSPPWATRALLEHVLFCRSSGSKFANYTCVEPACGRGDMARTLCEYFNFVYAADIFAYNESTTVEDFLEKKGYKFSVDWIITNPPFKNAADFVLHALSLANCGVAILERTVFIESVGRWQKLYQRQPPTKVGIFVERVPIVRGRLSRTATTATSYSWFVWEKTTMAKNQLVFIPPCRAALERDGDYPEDISLQLPADFQLD